MRPLITPSITCFDLSVLLNVLQMHMRGGEGVSACVINALINPWIVWNNIFLFNSYYIRLFEDVWQGSEFCSSQVEDWWCFWPFLWIDSIFPVTPRHENYLERPLLDIFALMWPSHRALFLNPICFLFSSTIFPMSLVPDSVSMLIAQAFIIIWIVW